MRAPRFRVRTMIATVGLVAVLLWATKMGSRSFDYYRRASEYGANEYGWRQIAARGRPSRAFESECAEYYAQLAEKYRRAMWRPWSPVAPDPYAPGVAEFLEQRRREAAEAHTNP